MGYKIAKRPPARSKKTPLKSLEALPHKQSKAQKQRASPLRVAQTQPRRANACPRELRPLPQPVLRYSYKTESKPLLQSKLVPVSQPTRRSPRLHRSNSVPEPPSQRRSSKRKRDAEEHGSTALAKRQLPPRRETTVDTFVYQWLDKLPSSRHSLTNTASVILLDACEMPLVKKDGKKSNYSASQGTSQSQKTKDSGTASVTDSNYRETLGHYNIAIEDETAPTEVVQQAIRMFSRSRDSPEPDDLTVNDLRDLMRTIKDADEDMVMRKIAGIIVPAIDKLPDDRLKVLINQLWTTRVHVPHDPNLYEPPLRLPKPKPDVAFGYSKEAFTTRQDSALGLLVSDVRGESYSVPCPGLRFPFLSIEFKSAAKGGNWYDGLGQVAGLGAVVMNNKLELSQETFGVETFKFNEPQFYSVTLDQRFALVNVHWVGKKPKGGYSFNLETVSEHALRDPIATKALRRTIKNIIDDGAGTGLTELTAAIDKYIEVLDERKAKEKEQASEAEAFPSPPEGASEQGRAESSNAASRGRAALRGKQSKTRLSGKEREPVKGTRTSKRNAKEMNET